VSIGGSRTATVTGKHTDNVKKDHSLTIGGSHVRVAHTHDNVTAGEELTEIIGGTVLESSGKTNTVTGGKTSTLLVGGSAIEVAKLGKSEGTSELRDETVSGPFFIKADERIGTRAEELRASNVGGSYLVLAQKELLIAGLEGLTVHAKTATFAGSTSITLKVADTVIRLETGKITMVGPKTISIETQVQNDLGTGTSSQN
jgi:hypothetical protein